MIAINNLTIFDKFDNFLSNLTIWTIFNNFFLFFWHFWNFDNCLQFWQLQKHNPGDLWHLWHWLHHCYLTIKNDSGQHWQFLQCFTLRKAADSLPRCQSCISMAVIQDWCNRKWKNKNPEKIWPQLSLYCFATWTMKI